MAYLRLKKQADFQKLFQKGKRVYTPSFTLLYKPSKQTTFGISLGKKHGKSVVRNRVKRLLREAFRAALPNMQGTYSLVVVPKAKENKNEYNYHEYEKHFLFVIKKEKL